MGETDRAAVLRARGGYSRWRPRDGDEVAVCHVESGDPDRPVLLLVHGFPTCSVDWFELVTRLEGRCRVCALDFPGHGSSDKPVGWGYSLGRDAELLDYYVRKVLGARSVVVLAHDRGSSVALNYLRGTSPGAPPVSRTAVEHLVATNANPFLPLSNLTAFQSRLLDGATAAAHLGALTPELLAAGMGAVTFSPARPAGHPDAAARVWDDYLALKPGRNRFYLVPGANHYLQVDKPARLAETFLHAEGGGPVAPGPLGGGDDAPVLVDWSRPRLPRPTEGLRADTPA